MTAEMKTFVAFAGTGLIARGTPAEVVRQSKDRLDRGEAERIALYDDESGRPIDIDFTGGEAEVLARLADHPMVAPMKEPAQRRGPGRPKLGVVSREVSLLPRHWSWLASQRGWRLRVPTPARRYRAKEWRRQ